MTMTNPAVNVLDIAVALASTPYTIGGDADRSVKQNLLCRDMAPWRDGIRRAAQALLIAATSPLATRCGEAAETGAAAGGPGSRSAIAPSAPLDDQDRRLMLRERLRASLGDRYDAPVPKATESDLQRGAELWHLLCAGCHARDARGRGSLPQMLPVQPGDLTDPRRAAFFSEA